MSRICLDYGHGGSDPGASYQGRREKDDNLKLGLAVAAELRRHGVSVSETRTADKTMSLKERSDFANRVGCDYFVSIHRNAFRPEQARGVETFVYTSPSTGSLQLADKIQAALVTLGFVDRKVKRENLHVVREVIGPSVLVEVGFLDNTADNQLYDAKWNEIVLAISGAILAQIGIAYSNPTPAPTPAGTPILGPAQATVGQAQAWAKSRGAHQRYVDIATIYWKYGQLTGIRPEVLYAQAAKETAFGKYGGAVTPDQNNWAGIKTKNASGDKREDHETFATPDDGVRAHFNHIAAYVGKNPIGEPHGRWLIVNTLSWAGKVRTVEELGGKWAPAADYGTSIIKDYLAPMLGTPPPGKPAGLPDISRTINVKIGNYDTTEIGYLINNSTYLRAAYLIGAVGGTVTGHGDYISLELPATVDPVELNELREANMAMKIKIANAKQALS